MAKVSTDSDRFDTLDEVHHWLNWGPTGATVTGGKLQITVPNAVANYYGIEQLDAFDATDSEAFVEVEVDDASPDELEVEFQYLFDGDNHLWFSIGNGLLRVYQEVANSVLQLTNAPYDPVAHRWLKFVESGGNITWQVSPTGLAGTWTDFYGPVATPLDITNIRVNMDAGCYDTTHGQVIATFDNFNIINPSVAWLSA